MRQLSFIRIMAWLALLLVPLFVYFFWFLSSSPDTLSDLKTTYPTLGEKITENLSTLPTLPIQETKESFTIEDSKPDGIEIAYAHETDAKLKTDVPKQTIVFPKDAKRPIEVKLDTERIIPITHLGEENYTLDTLTRTEAETPFLTRLFQRDESSREYLRYAGERKMLLYAYEKDQATGAKRLKHWTLYDTGTGLEEEQYRFENVKIKLNERGEAEVFYYGDKQIQNDAAAKQVEPSLLERAQRTLEHDLGQDLLNNQTPDFIIPKPYYLDSRGEQHGLEWKWNEETKTLSVSFSPESYPVALDPTLSFIAPGQSNAGSVMTGEATSNYFGYSLTAGDFNSDGRVDLAVGATGYSSYTGRTYLFYNDGSIPTTAATADVIITGEASNNFFGVSLTADDFNSDGRVDLAVGATGYSSYTGRTYLFYNDGSIPTTAATADVIITGEATFNSFGYSLTAGDFNSDGRVDLAVGATGYSSFTGRTYLFYNDGSIPTTAATADVIITGESGSSFGSSLTAGDFNSDGRVDLAVGAQAYSSDTGRTYLFYNDGSIPTTAATADVIITGEISFNYFGVSLTAGDFNSDGRVDLAVGAQAYSSSTGRTYVYTFGNDPVMTGEATSNYFGHSLTAGDFNSDGRVDLAVGATGYSFSTGRTYLFYSDGSIPTTAATADVIITGESSSTFGVSLTAGDFNSDGRVDLAVGAPGYSFSTGRTYLFYNDGSIPTTAATADVIITGESSSTFGSSLTAGDFNSDGRVDLAVGAYVYSSFTGRTYLFYNDGSIPTTAATADVIITGEATSNSFGISLTAGDFNSDGRVDLAVGATGYSSSTGRTYIFYNDGSIPTTAATADVIITGEASNNYFGISLTAGDFNSDGRVDLAVGAYGYSSSIGRTYLFYSDGSIPTTAATADVIITGEATSNYFGRSLTAGDFNSDGRVDLAVGAYLYSSATGRTYLFTSELAPTNVQPATLYLKGTGKLKGSATLK